MSGVRAREAGDSALIAEFDAAIDPAVNARAIGMAANLRSRRIRGVRDVVSTFHSVAVTFDALATDVAALRAAMEGAAECVAPLTTGRAVEVPVVYGGDAGPDLKEVAAFAGCTPAEVVSRHASRAYRVYMLGFLPGYPYMAAVDETIAMPRREAPRLRVPAGSVGIAGRQTGIYPCESPGGWRIVGRTALRLFDPEGLSPALLGPGDEVRFVPVSADAASGVSRTDVRPEADAVYVSARSVTVLTPGLLTTIQDEGRWGHQHLGVPVAGPMDAFAHRLANAVLGNPREAATLETTLAGLALRFEQDAWISIAGADLHPSVDGRNVRPGTPVQCRAGSVLRLAACRSGARAYVAADGGFAVPPVLGSRATHVSSGLGGLGGRPLRAGDRVPLGNNNGIIGRASQARQHEIEGFAPRPSSHAGARLRILPGPQVHHFAASAFETLQEQPYVVSPHSNRMGYRLIGRAPVAAPPGEMISEAAFFGGLQVPPSGEPILLMADRQTTGGYPQLAVVIAADLPLAAQLVPGDRVEFRACTPAEALAARRMQEEELGEHG